MRVSSQKFFLMDIARWISAPALAGLLIAGARAQTDIEVTGETQVAAVRAFGIGLAQHNYYDSAQMMKELLFRNPGFEGLLFQSVVPLGGNGTQTSAIENAPYGQWPTGFWAGAAYEIAVSPTAEGRSGTVTTSIAPDREPWPNDPAGSPQGTTYVFADENPAAIPSAGDFMILRKTFHGEGGGAADASWTPTYGNGSSVSTEFADNPPGSDGVQCVRLAGLPGAPASVRGEFDTTSGFTLINGPHTLRFKAKCAAGNPQLGVTVRRGNSVYASAPQLAIGADWQDYALPVSANETSAGLGSLAISFSTVGNSTVLLDDVSFRKDGGDPTNPTAFRDEIVWSLRELRPSILRYVNWQNLGNSLENELAPVFGRRRSGCYVIATTENNLMPGLHEFLELCAHTGADPWYSFPATFSPAEAAALVEYLAGDATTPMGGLRAQRGRAEPWTTAFDTIHLEFGNEHWNPGYRGAAFATPAACGARAAVLFSAIKSSPHYSSLKFSCVLGWQAGNPTASAQAHNASPLHDRLAIAPYLSGRVDTYKLPDESLDVESLFGALFAEPEWWSANRSTSPGLVRQLFNSVQVSARPVPLAVYEVNLHTTEGAIEQFALDAYTPSVGAAIAVAGHMLTMLKDCGIREQVFFSLPGFRYSFSENRTAALWGIQRDFGPTQRKRPHFYAQSMLNRALAGDLVRTLHTGDDPTWSVDNVNRVSLSNAHIIQSHAFRNGSRRALLVFNLDRELSRRVTFSGMGAPSGDVTLTRLTSQEVTDHNEDAEVVAPVVEHQEAFDPDVPLELPPFSMSLLEWDAPPRHAWRHEYFGSVSGAGDSADLADPDSDGLVNFLEYAIGRSPLAASAAPPARLESVPAGGWEFVFNRTRPELIYTVETCTDLALGDWVVEAENPGTVGGEVRVTVDPTPGGRKFARLRVREAPTGGGT